VPQPRNPFTGMKNIERIKSYPVKGSAGRLNSVKKEEGVKLGAPKASQKNPGREAPTIFATKRKMKAGKRTGGDELKRKTELIIQREQLRPSNRTLDKSGRGSVGCQNCALERVGLAPRRAGS